MDDSTTLPKSKLVQRADLYSLPTSAQTSPSPTDLQLEYAARIAHMYGPVQLHAPAESILGEKALEPKTECEFRLFGSGGTQWIQLHTDSDDFANREAGFVVGRRLNATSYYFTSRADGQRRRGFELMAVSGEDVIRRRACRAWGLELPWRVSVIKMGRCQMRRLDGELIPQHDIHSRHKDRRTKPGKKRRIGLRQKRRTLETLREDQARELELKEQLERGKKTLRNREKKLKKKQRAKAKKAGGGDEANRTPNPEPAAA